MTQAGPKKFIELTEYKPELVPRELIAPGVGETLWKRYRAQVAVEPPSFKTDNHWQLESQGWVGFIPLGEEFGIALLPKVRLENIFRMLEYAYRLESFQFLKGLIDCKSLADFYERLANILAHRVLDRGRKGFYRTYVPESDALPFLRGRISLSSVLQRPWDVRFHCHYEEHTGDVVENQILSWTLSRIAQSGMCTDRVLPTVRRGYHSIRGFASLQPFRPHDCIGRLYNRLNEDYQPLHALCRFFLEHTGPSHEIGDRRMLPFLVNMERLFELFVAEWLKVNLPPHLSLRVQEKVEVAETHELFFKIDLVLYSVETGKALCVLDTKYKTKEKPDSDDIAQVIAYAEMKGCQQALLVYPQMIPSSLDINVGRIRVRTATFVLSGDLEEAGRAFRQDILKGLETTAQERGGWE